MRRLTAAALVVLALVAGVGCTEKSSTAAGRLILDGRAEVVTAAGDRAFVTANRTLRSGDQVRMLDGTSVLGLGGGPQLELRKGSVVRLGVTTAATGQASSQGELIGGDVLVTSTDQATTVVVGGTEVQVQGAARISRTLTVVTAVYEGAAGVASAGRSASVPALRQVTVAAPGVIPRPAPLLPSPSDSWDQRYLGDAVELSNQLVARSRGFSAQLAAGEGTTPGFYRQLLPGLESEPFTASLLDPARAPGETLVGAAITLAGSKDTFVDRWANVFAFHADGAPWGLVALDQKVNRSAVLSQVDGAIARRAGPSELAAPAGTTATTAPGPIALPIPQPIPLPTPLPVPTTLPPASSSGSPGSSGTVPAATTPTTTPPSTGSGGPSRPGGTTSGPVPGSDRGPVDLGVPLVDDTLNGVVDALSGLLNSLGK